MVSLLKWILRGIKNLCRLVKTAGLTLGQVLSSLVTWLAATIYYITDTLWDWASEKISGFFDGVSGLLSDSPVGEDFFSLSPLAEHLCNVFALDVAVQCLLYVFSAFVMARLLRLAMIPARAVLEVL